MRQFRSYVLVTLSCFLLTSVYQVHTLQVLGEDPADVQAEIEAQELPQEEDAVVPEEEPQEEISEEEAPVQEPAEQESKEEEATTPLEKTEQSEEETPTEPAVPVESPVEATPITSLPEDEASEPEKTDVSLDNIDLDEPGGNWLLKRIWWENGKVRYEKIKEIFDKILESRMNFYQQRTDLDRTVFDPFYKETGFGLGELSSIIKNMIEQLKSLREREGTLNAKEREVLDDLDGHTGILEQLQLDIQAVGDVDNAIDDALAQLLEQVNLCRKYERQAWDEFKSIAKVLNDKKARELYYGMETHYKNMQDIAAYVDGPYKEHFEKLIAATKEHVERIKTAVNELKEQGVDLKKQVQLIKVSRGVSSSEEEEESEEQYTPSVWQRFFVQPMSWIGVQFKAGFSALSKVFGWLVEGVKSLFAKIASWFSHAPKEDEGVEEELSLATESIADNEIPVSSEQIVPQEPVVPLPDLPVQSPATPELTLPESPVESPVTNDLKPPTLDFGFEQDVPTTETIALEDAPPLVQEEPIVTAPE